MPPKRIKFASDADRIFYRADRDTAWAKQKFRCAYCGDPLPRSVATSDHIIPLSKTGRMHHPRNIAAACKKCNREKGSQDAKDFSSSVSLEAELTRLRHQLIELEDPLLAQMLERIEQRTRQAEYRLSLNPMGSYRKWENYHGKRGRWK